MTAVAQPLPFQPSTRIGWAADGSGFGTKSPDEVTRMFHSGGRKTVQRQNSSSSVASTSSSTSSGSTATIQPMSANGSFTTGPDVGSWAGRKKPTRTLWPPGKAEAATGLSTARTQSVNSATSGPTATSSISALHAPIMPSHPMTNGVGQANGNRHQTQVDPPAILHLLPMNGTFERKAITVPYYPDVLRVGRQTNQKTMPNPLNGYFDSKVLSRQHAEVYADRQGRIFIRDVKSSNGTFVNGMRLSQENKESEPRELREQDVLELGIDIVSEDQKTVVHHKVAAKVEHAGVYSQGTDALNFSDLDPSGGGAVLGTTGSLRRNGSQGSLTARSSLNPIANQALSGPGMLNQPQHMRNWLNPITAEHLVKKLNTEMKLAVQQSQELFRAKQSIQAILDGKGESLTKDQSVKVGSDKSRLSPIKSKIDIKAHFSEPPAPPPSAPLPEKPDMNRASADSLVQPLLRRSDTARPPSGDNSPTRFDHASDILRLCEELKLAKGELSTQNERMKHLEHELAQERTARESAEERAERLERRRDSPRDSFSSHQDAGSGVSADGASQSPPDFTSQLEQMQSSLDEMKRTIESYRNRAETAEAERDEARQTLAEIVEHKRRENSSASTQAHVYALGDLSKGYTKPLGTPTPANGHATRPLASSPTSDILLERAGVEEGRPITLEQAKILTHVLSQEVLQPQYDYSGRRLQYYGVPTASALSVVILGYVLMRWMNVWEKIDT